jgi:hypothetical protein
MQLSRDLTTLCHHDLIERVGEGAQSRFRRVQMSFTGDAIWAIEEDPGCPDHPGLRPQLLRQVFAHPVAAALNPR